MDRRRIRTVKLDGAHHQPVAGDTKVTNYYDIASRHLCTYDVALKLGPAHRPLGLGRSRLPNDEDEEGAGSLDVDHRVALEDVVLGLPGSIDLADDAFMLDPLEQPGVDEGGLDEGRVGVVEVRDTARP